MQVDANPLKKANSMYAEVVAINMVDISDEFGTELPPKDPAPEAKLQTDAEMVSEDHQFENAMVNED